MRKIIISNLLCVILGITFSSFLSNDKFDAKFNVAVVNNDQPVMVDKKQVKYSQSIVLKKYSDDKFKQLKFTNTYDKEAIDGFEAKKYDAIIKINDNFTRSILSISTKKPEKSNIEVSVNSDLTVEDNIKISLLIDDFINDVKQDISYLYVYEIFDGLHKTQFKIDEVIKLNEGLKPTISQIKEINVLDNYNYELNALNGDSATAIDLSEFQTKLGEVIVSVFKQVEDVLIIYKDENSSLLSLITNNGELLNNVITSLVDYNDEYMGFISELSNQTIDENYSITQVNEYLNKLYKQLITEQITLAQTIEVMNLINENYLMMVENINGADGIYPFKNILNIIKSRNDFYKVGSEIDKCLSSSELSEIEKQICVNNSKQNLISTYKAYLDSKVVLNNDDSYYKSLLGLISDYEVEDIELEKPSFDVSFSAEDFNMSENDSTQINLKVTNTSTNPIKSIKITSNMIEFDNLSEEIESEIGFNNINEVKINTPVLLTNNQSYEFKFKIKTDMINDFNLIENLNFKIQTLSSDDLVSEKEVVQEIKFYEKYISNASSTMDGQNLIVNYSIANNDVSSVNVTLGNLSSDIVTYENVTSDSGFMSEGKLEVTILPGESKDIEIVYENINYETFNFIQIIEEQEKVMFSLENIVETKDLEFKVTESNKVISLEIKNSNSFSLENKVITLNHSDKFVDFRMLTSGHDIYVSDSQILINTIDANEILKFDISFNLLQYTEQSEVLELNYEGTTIFEKTYYEEDNKLSTIIDIKKDLNSDNFEIKLQIEALSDIDNILVSIPMSNGEITSDDVLFNENNGNYEFIISSLKATEKYEFTINLKAYVENFNVFFKTQDYESNSMFNLEENNNIEIINDVKIVKENDLIKLQIIDTNLTNINYLNKSLKISTSDLIFKNVTSSESFELINNEIILSYDLNENEIKTIDLSFEISNLSESNEIEISDELNTELINFELEKIDVQLISKSIYYKYLDNDFYADSQFASNSTKLAISLNLINNSNVELNPGLKINDLINAGEITNLELPTEVVKVGEEFKIYFELNFDLITKLDLEILEIDVNGLKIMFEIKYIYTSLDIKVDVKDENSNNIISKGEVVNYTYTLTNNSISEFNGVFNLSVDPNLIVTNCYILDSNGEIIDLNVSPSNIVVKVKPMKSIVVVLNTISKDYSSNVNEITINHTLNNGVMEVVNQDTTLLTNSDESISNIATEIYEKNNNYFNFMSTIYDLSEKHNLLSSLQNYNNLIKMFVKHDDSTLFKFLLSDEYEMCDISSFCKVSNIINLIKVNEQNFINTINLNLDDLNSFNEVMKLINESSNIQVSDLSTTIDELLNLVVNLNINEVNLKPANENVNQINSNMNETIDENIEFNNNLFENKVEVYEKNDEIIDEYLEKIKSDKSIITSIEQFEKQLGDVSNVENNTLNNINELLPQSKINNQPNYSVYDFLVNPLNDTYRSTSIDESTTKTLVQVIILCILAIISILINIYFKARYDKSKENRGN